MTEYDNQWEKQLKAEREYRRRRMSADGSRLNAFLAEKVPDKLRDTLNAGFAKAFEMIFEKGSTVIEKTYNRRDMERSARVRRLVAENRRDNKSLAAASLSSSSSKLKNTLFSGVIGMGMGLVGVGIPDIPVFTALLLRSVYEIALSFGYDYDKPEEKYFILLLIGAALRRGEDFAAADEGVNFFIENGSEADDELLRAEIVTASEGLSGELLYMKFLQGIPIVGAVGGAYDPVYIDRVTDYAQLKYNRRFLFDIRR